jgi:hypothetical protein
MNENTIEETDREKGKVVRIARFEISRDGKTMIITEERTVKGMSRQYIAHKQ